MHRYFPHTAEDEARMLGVVGADTVEDLFASIPSDCRHEGPLPLTAMTEWELTARAEELASRRFRVDRRGELPAPYPRRGPGPDGPLRILHRLYAVPA